MPRPGLSRDRQQAPPYRVALARCTSRCVRLRSEGTRRFRGLEVYVSVLSLKPKWEMTTPNKTPPGADPKQLERTGTVREIGSQAVWSLSSCKPGFGVDQLRDDNLETYWQSDGSQPHLVNIQFRRKTTVKTLCIYADYKSDESYTPSKISVRVGNNFHNLQEIRHNAQLDCKTSNFFIGLK
ncbi:anaphase-promoting complex subunit 10 isoform X4 [Mauremys reevesii]|uniref:anaphase-promoting complex subunit 10 isoform X4 n=1 Tax=Mauremys reevesii TaxID=260615 RepID=UPI00193FEF80|nr:anaphase-promoting complex subunit 10 isoform X4 [Mauremys reevesii]